MVILHFNLTEPRQIFLGMANQNGNSLVVANNIGNND